MDGKNEWNVKCTSFDEQQIVEVTGEIFENGITMTVEYISVRPAIWIKK